MEHADKLLMGDGAKTLGSARKTMASLERSSAQLASMLKSNQGALHNGLQGFNDLAPALKELRVTLRSEEHTSELQSLMRISYAVFCLKKKKKTIEIRTST